MNNIYFFFLLLWITIKTFRLKKKHNDKKPWFKGVLFGRNFVYSAHGTNLRDFKYFCVLISQRCWLPQRLFKHCMFVVDLIKEMAIAHNFLLHLMLCGSKSNSNGTLWSYKSRILKDSLMLLQTNTKALSISDIWIIFCPAFVCNFALQLVYANTKSWLC